MIDPHWVYAGAALGLVGAIRYAVAVVRGGALPHLVTWSMWALAPLVGFLAQLDAGVGMPALMTLAAGLGPLIVVLASLITRRHDVRLGPFDVACAVVSGGALAVWLGWGAAPTAVLLAVAADAVAALPTLVKAWRRPHTEHPLFYVLVGLGATITLLTISVWTPESWAFAAYQLGACVVIVSVVITRRRMARVC